MSLLFNSFHVAGIFLYSLKTENQSFLIFSGGIEKDQWYGMGERFIVLFP